MINYPFRNLVFEGGGVKGIAYVGALEELNKRGVLKQIERVGGTSAGAITAVLVALKYSVEEIREILWNLDFTRFMDDDWGIFRDAHRLINQFGFFKGDYFRIWISEIIEEKTGDYNTSFKALHDMGFLDLYLIGSNLSTGYSEIFSWEHTPNMAISEAARISMSIPLFFQAVRNQDSEIYVDGGLFNNFPVKLFDVDRYIRDPEQAERKDYYEEENQLNAYFTRVYGRNVFNRETLGFRLDSKEEIAAFRDRAPLETQNINDFSDYLRALLKAVLNQQDSRHLHSDDWKRTVYIDCQGVGAIDFEISNQRKKQLVEAGISGVHRFLEWYDGVNDG